MEDSASSESVQRLRRALAAIEKLQGRVRELEGAAAEPIAIVGIGVRMPGGADTPAAFWRLLENGVDATSEVPRDRWDVNHYYDPDPDAPGRMYTRRGAFVDHLREFDAPFFRISPREALSLDPQQRLVLEVTWESLEDAGIAADKLGGSSTGLFLGIASTEYFQHLEKHGHDENDLYVGTGNTHSAAAGRVSYVLGLQGPSIAVDTACSSSLVAVHLACQSLRNRECDLALAGGVNRIVAPQVSVHFSKIRALSRDGRCKTFDASADGYGRGEGCGFVVMQRLSDALAQNRMVRAVVLGSAVNHDGASSGLTVPSGQAQQAVIRKALEKARIKAAEVSYVEAHGTGTPLGDPIEIRALQAAYGAGRPADDPLMVGSVKTNVGHLEPAAGIAGLIKTVLALQHGRIPPHLHCREPNPQIPWNDCPIRIPAHATPWPLQPGRPRTAGVSAFGFSGTNAHVILREYDGANARTEPKTPDGDWQILAVSAKSDQALAQLVERYRLHLEAEPGQSLGEICYNAAVGRAHFACRRAVVVDSKAAAAAQLSVAGRRRSAGEPPRVAFMFTGQGSQYVGMARGLHESERGFRRLLEQADATLQAQGGPGLLALLYGGAAEPDRLQLTANAQPALFAIEYALARLWIDWGVEPVALLGHSIGEYVAACLAGVFRFEDALKLVAARGRLMGSLPAGGGMLAVAGAEARVAEVLRADSGIAIAALNGPTNTVVSGAVEALDRAAVRLAAAELPSKRLAVSHAFHSPLMEPILSAFYDVACQINYSTPRLAVISNLFGRAVLEEMAAPEYWVRHLREPVRFADGVAELNRLDVDVVVEAGPAPTLLGLARACGIASGVKLLPSLSPGKPDRQTVFGSLAGLYEAGCPIHWEAVYRDRGARHVVLPTYPFQRQRYWLEPQAPEPPRKQDLAHPLLGRGIHLAAPHRTTLFETAALSAGRADYLGDHRMNGKAILPAAAYLEMGLAAAGVLEPGSAWQIEHQTFEKVLPLADARLRLALEPASGRGWAFDFSSSHGPANGAADPEWTCHSRGTLSALSGIPDWTAANPIALRESALDSISADSFYTRCAEMGVNYGPTFRGLSQVWRLEAGAIGRVAGPPELTAELGAYVFHPALLDACLQPLGIVIAQSDGGGPWVPRRIGRFAVLQQPRAGEELWSYCLRSHAAYPDPEDGAVLVNACICDRDGRLMAFLERLEVVRVVGVATPPQRSLEDWFYDVQWRVQAPPIAANAAADPAAGAALGAHSIAARLRADLPAILAERPALDGYLRGFEALEQAACALAASALQTLRAGKWEPGEALSTEELGARLGVAAQHQRLFSRLLDVLADRGTVIREGARWMARHAPDGGEPVLLLRQIALRHSEVGAEASLLGATAPRLAEVLTGGCDPIPLLFPGGDLSAATRLYRDSPGAELLNHLLARALRAFVDGRPAGGSVRVLEIGGGTGATTAAILSSFDPVRTDYLFTDVSTLFTGRMDRDQSDRPWLRTGLLDIEKDPIAQGLPPHGFDIIIAAHVLHATEDLERTLAHVRALLAPGGLLALLEPTSSTRTSELTFGLLPGWWRFTDVHRRPHTPLLPGAEWELLLDNCGFAQVDVLAPAGEETTQAGGALILAQLETAPVARPAKTWIVFADAIGTGSRLASEVRAQGDRCVLVRPGAAYRMATQDTLEIDPCQAEHYTRLLREFLPHSGGGPAPEVVYLWATEAEAADPHQGARGLYAPALHLVQAAVAAAGTQQTPRMCLVTRNSVPYGTTMEPSGVAASVVWGLGKTAALEHPELNCVLVDLDSTASDGDAACLLSELTSTARHEQVVYRSGVRHVGRLARSTTGRPHALGMTQRGTPENLRFEPFAPSAPGPGQVQVCVRATGLNFADVMDSLGLLPFARSGFGVEFAGEVCEVGAGVTQFAVGDRVFGAAQRSFDSHVTVGASRVRHIPRNLSFAEAATITVAFATAYHALCDVAGIGRGSRVLIHAGGGGVGLAAVQLARLHGAEVFATASTGKRERLAEWGVAHVMNSRTTGFADEVLAFTGGEGVDVVLNSLSGEFIPASLRALKPTGCFVEIGKLDIWDSARVAAIRPEARYRPIDLLPMLSGDGDRSLDPLLDPLVRLFEDGRLKPLPFTSFGTDGVIQAFRYMQQARHFGKVVVVREESAGTAPQPRFRNEVSYLVTGGFGGVGLAAADWLVERGARRLVLLGRGGPKPEDAVRLDLLKERGVSVQAVHGSVTDEVLLSRIFAESAQAGAPIRGIIHSAAVVDDAGILNQDLDRFDRVMAPKADGAWLLHSLSGDLDFFLLFSAGASLMGNPGQANYVAANAFVDALAHYRRQRGLPAMAVNWGAWSGTGMAASRGLDEKARAKGFGSIDPSQAAPILDRLYAANAIQTGVLPIDWGAAAAHYAEWPFVSGLLPSRAADAAGGPELLRKLAGLTADEQRVLIGQHVRSLVAGVLGIRDADEVGHNQGFFDLGMDSLTAVELRNRLQSTVGEALPPTLAFDYPTVGGLIEFLCGRLVSRPATALAGGQPDHEVSSREVSALLDDIERLSEGEALASLRRRNR